MFGDSTGNASSTTRSSNLGRSRPRNVARAPEHAHPSRLRSSRRAPRKLVATDLQRTNRRRDGRTAGTANCRPRGLTVPDLEGAVRFYCDVLGAEELYGMGPFDAAELPATPDGRDWTDAHVNVPDARLSFRVLKVGTTMLELFHYERPTGATRRRATAMPAATTSASRSTIWTRRRPIWKGRASPSSQARSRSRRARRAGRCGSTTSWIRGGTTSS